MQRGVVRRQGGVEEAEQESARDHHRRDQEGGQRDATELSQRGPGDSKPDHEPDGHVQDAARPRRRPRQVAPDLAYETSPSGQSSGSHRLRETSTAGASTSSSGCRESLCGNPSTSEITRRAAPSPNSGSTRSANFSRNSSSEMGFSGVPVACRTCSVLVSPLSNVTVAFASVCPRERSSTTRMRSRNSFTSGRLTFSSVNCLWRAVPSIQEIAPAKAMLNLPSNPVRGSRLLVNSITSGCTPSSIHSTSPAGAPVERASFLTASIAGWVTTPQEDGLMATRKVSHLSPSASESASG